MLPASVAPVALITAFMKKLGVKEGARGTADGLGVVVMLFASMPPAADAPVAEVTALMKQLGTKAGEAGTDCCRVKFAVVMNVIELSVADITLRGLSVCCISRSLPRRLCCCGPLHSQAALLGSPHHLYLAQMDFFQQFCCMMPTPLYQAFCSCCLWALLSACSTVPLCCMPRRLCWCGPLHPQASFLGAPHLLHLASSSQGPCSRGGTLRC